MEGRGGERKEQERKGGKECVSRERGVGGGTGTVQDSAVGVLSIRHARLDGTPNAYVN